MWIIRVRTEKYLQIEFSIIIIIVINFRKSNTFLTNRGLEMAKRWLERAMNGYKGEMENWVKSLTAFCKPF